MVDLKVNTFNDIMVDPATNELAVVRGKDAVEQKIALQVVALFYDMVGQSTTENVLRRAELFTKRAASELGILDDVAAFEARFAENDPQLVLVRVHYDYGESFEFAANPRDEDEQ